MEAIVWIALIGAGIWALVRFGRKVLRRGQFTETNSGFTQAGVSVDYETGSITIDGRTFGPDKIRSIAWSNGHGKFGNISLASIALHDMAKPVHRIEFATPDGAETFTSRFELALNRVGWTAR